MLRLRIAPRVFLTELHIRPPKAGEEGHHPERLMRERWTATEAEALRAHRDLAMDAAKIAEGSDAAEGADAGATEQEAEGG